MTHYWHNNTKRSHYGFLKPLGPKLYNVGMNCLLFLCKQKSSINIMQVQDFTKCHGQHCEITATTVLCRYTRLSLSPSLSLWMTFSVANALVAMLLLKSLKSPNLDQMPTYAPTLNIDSRNNIVLWMCSHNIGQTFMNNLLYFSIAW